MSENAQKLSYDEVLQRCGSADYFSYLLLDGCGQDNLAAFIYGIEKAPQGFFPLYLHTRYEELMDASPCLIKVSQASPLLSWYLENQQNSAQGILITSKSDIEELAAHLQFLLEAQLPAERIVMLRYYDPVVLNYVAPIFRSKAIFRGPMLDLFYPDSQENLFNMLYADEAEDLDFKPNSYPSPLIALSAQDDQIIQAGARQTLLEKIETRLQLEFPAKSKEQCFAATKQAQSICEDLQMKNASTLHDLSKVIVLNGSVPEKLMLKLQNTDLHELHRRAMLEPYLKNAEEFANE